MRTIRLKTACAANESVIVCRRQVFEKELFIRREGLKKDGAIIFTDSNVFDLYGGHIKKHLGEISVYIMEAGEANKNEKTLFSLLNAMATAGLKRNSTLIALGGGVVGDIGGLAASLYMRGINCIQVPTTLLAQVDSSVGGKTAIDFYGAKNLIGAFYAPRQVFVDSAFLKTLPQWELRSGLGEMIKHGVLRAPLFEALWENKDNLFNLEFLARIVPENIAFKASIIKQDPFEMNLRKCLNLGHTTAHALELSGIDLSHGECVLIGLIFESMLAERYCAYDRGFLMKLRELCIAALGGKPSLPQEMFLRQAMFDKKNTEKNKVVLTVPTAPERYEFLTLPYEEYARVLKEIKEALC